MHYCGKARAAGFTIHTPIKVRVMEGGLVLTAQAREDVS